MAVTLTATIFHSLSLFPDISALPGVSWAVSSIVGLHPKKCCSCPDSRLKKGSGSSGRDINGLLDRGFNTSETNGSGVTPSLWVAASRQDMASNLSYYEETEATVYRANWHRVGSSFTMETRSWGTSGSWPSQGQMFLFNNRAVGDTLVWGLEQSLAGAGGRHAHVNRGRRHRTGGAEDVQWQNSHLEWPDHTSRHAKGQISYDSSKHLAWENSQGK